MSKAKMKVLLVAAVLLAGAGSAQAQVKLLNVSYDPTRELYQDVNKAFAAQWKQKTGQSVDDQPVARRIGQAGPLDHRRPRGRRRDAGARLRHRRHRPELRPHQERLAEAAANNSAPYTSTIVFVVRKGNPRGIKRLGRSGQAGHQRRDAEPEDLGRGALELPGRVGLGAEAVRRRPGEGQGVHPDALQERAGARFGRARLDDHLRAARDRPRAPRLGERGVLPGRRDGEEQVRDRHARASASWPSRRSPWSTRTSTSTARARPPRRTSNSSTRPRARRSPPSITTARAIAAVAEDATNSLRQGHADHHRRRVRRLAEGAEGRISPTAGRSIRSTSRAHERGGAPRDGGRR